MKRRLAALTAGTLVVVCGAAACGGAPQERAGEGNTREQTVREEGRAEEEVTGEETRETPRQKQLATYYGEEFADNPTASGEAYDPQGMTAAHKTLPFGAVLEVCYRGCARVEINDRNPNAEADLDLSLAAAERVGLVPDGRGVVEAEVVE